MERRTIWAILLMMVIAIAPALFIKRAPRAGTPVSRAGVPADTTHRASDSAAASAAPAAAASPTAATSTAAVPADTNARADTVRVTSPLYTYGISTRGGRLVSARLTQFKSLWPADHGVPVELVGPGNSALGLGLVANGDTVRLEDWQYTPSATSLTVNGPTTLSCFAAVSVPRNRVRAIAARIAERATFGVLQFSLRWASTR